MEVSHVLVLLKELNMSRSYRKNPIRKGKHDSHALKKMSSRIFRHKSKDRMVHEDYENLPLNKGEGLDRWEIYDWAWRQTLQEAIDDYEQDQQRDMNGGPSFRAWWKDKTREDVINTWKKTFYYK
jgi:hypothetical protein